MYVISGNIHPGSAGGVCFFLIEDLSFDLNSQNLNGFQAMFPGGSILIDVFVGRICISFTIHERAPYHEIPTRK
ncbi:hypothetical protein PGT21_006139 [Puccinia graminis f. sp. tritici]|uniref:Uncharacterized protein n=1 Tax=Puccinia graminis f. sp. tritici TaxID=56615 RepID=A0A5B0QEF5_PUCGR|nr:hypothetical protein PGT21_006139 [Puccinia graminis f. sp. tritici]